VTRISKSKELTIRVAANDLRGALEEVIFLAVLQALDKGGGGLRHEQSKQRFASAVVGLREAMW